jgi:RNA 3'-terminal phosphate cyclase (ATP)
MARKKKPLELLGTTLEGGGQLLRLSIGLAALTSNPLRLTHIRGNRGGGGGLKLQHLKAVEWLAHACGSRLEGAERGSKTLEFWPREEGEGNLKGDIDIGSPGAVALVFQAILPYLIFAGYQHVAPSIKPIKITIAGGTNVSKSPSIEYVQHVLLPTLRKIGVPEISATLEQRGWSTGRTQMGKVSFAVTPLAGGTTLPAFQLIERGDITRVEAYVLAPASCKKDIEHELTAKVYGTFGNDIELALHYEDSKHDKRLYLLLIAISANGHRLGRDWLYDEKIKSLASAIPRLVKRVVKELEGEVQHGGCVDEYMRDQLAVFQALAEGRSEIEAGREESGRGVTPSLHALTTYWVADLVAGVEFDQDGVCVGCGMKAKGGVDAEDTEQVTERVKQLEV